VRSTDEGAQESDQITRTVDLYVEGCREGDAAKLREAFHPDARMWGSMLGERYDEPIAEMIAMVDGKPVDADRSYQARVTAVEQTEDVASVVLVEDGFWGSVSFVDYLISPGSTASGRSSTRHSPTPEASLPPRPRGQRANLPSEADKPRSDCWWSILRQRASHL
jgi:Putative lumazine-binding